MSCTKTHRRRYKVRPFRFSRGFEWSGGCGTYRTVSRVCTVHGLLETPGSSTVRWSPGLNHLWQVDRETHPFHLPNKCNDDTGPGSTYIHSLGAHEVCCGRESTSCPLIIPGAEKTTRAASIAGRPGSRWTEIAPRPPQQLPILVRRAGPLTAEQATPHRLLRNQSLESRQAALRATSTSSSRSIHVRHTTQTPANPRRATA